MVTGPEQEVGIPSGKNGMSKSVHMGSEGVHSLRNTEKQAGMKTLDATLRSMDYEPRKNIESKASSHFL